MIHRFFATELAQGPLPGLKAPEAKRLREKVLREAYAFREIDDAGRRWSARNYVQGYTSYGSLTDLPERSPTFAKLRQSLDRAVADYAQGLQWDLQGGKLKMVSCWINIMGEGAHHSGHIHPLAVISGTYYVQVPPKASALKIEDPRLGFLMARPPVRAQGKKDVARRLFVDLTPREGDVILFESWLRHEVPANRDIQDRVSISFNYDWVSS
jgi:uncharacterized protein (TIGR02466 family)